MEIVGLILIILWIIFLAIDFIINKKAEKLMDETFDMLWDSQYKRMDLLCQMLEIKTIIRESEENKEMYRDTVQKIKEIVNDHKSNN